jgi:hypothetical protein
MVKDVVYDDSAPWPTAADGAGFSLVLIAPLTNPDHNDPANWRASMTTGGNPGSDDAVHLLASPTADDDADGFSNLVEYALGENPQISHAMTPDGLTITIPRVRNADDAEIVGEVSTTLNGWTTADLIGSTDTSLTFRVPSAFATENRIFIRATVRLR